MNNIDSKIKYAESKISYFLTKLKQFWIIILITSIACGAIGGVVTMLTYSPIYTVTQAFTIELRDNPNANQVGMRESQLSKTVPALLSSDTFMQYMAPIIEKEGIWGRFKVSSLSNTNIFYLTVESKSNKNATRIIELINENYSDLADKVIGESRMVLMAVPSTNSLPSNSPHYAKNTAIGFLIGLVISLAILVLQALLSKTITSASEAEILLKSECLSTIDEIKKKRRSANKDRPADMPLITDSDASLELKQSINRLTTKVLSRQSKDNIKTIMITSTISGEGKTSICVNLACNLAEIGKKVLIIDCDLRAPNVHYHINADTKTNALSQAISNPENTKDLIVKTNIQNLNLLANEEKDENASNITNGDNVKAIIDIIKDEYDFIILDTPPVGYLGDGISISEASDGFIYVISYNYINTNYVKRSLEDFNGSNTQMLGFVINHKR